MRSPNSNITDRSASGYPVQVKKSEMGFSLIETTIAHLLPEYKENSIRVNEYDIEDFSDVVKVQTEEMHRYCADAELNVPLPKEEFPMTERLNFCKTCKYRELCGRM